MNVYQLEGSEDGTLGIYGSATRAVQRALKYVDKQVTKEATLAGLREVKKDGFIIIYVSETSLISSTVTMWSVD